MRHLPWREGSPAIPLTVQDDSFLSYYSKPNLNLPINSYILHFPVLQPQWIQAIKEHVWLDYPLNTTGASLRLECPSFLFSPPTNFRSFFRTKINVISFGKTFPASPDRGGHFFFHTLIRIYCSPGYTGSFWNQVCCVLIPRTVPDTQLVSKQTQLLGMCNRPSWQL